MQSRLINGQNYLNTSHIKDMGSRYPWSTPDVQTVANVTKRFYNLQTWGEGHCEVKWPSARWKPLHELDISVFLCFFPYKFVINPRPGGGLCQLRHGVCVGGRVHVTSNQPPPSNSKAKRARKTQKKKSLESSRQFFRKYFSHFFATTKNGDSWAQTSQIFLKFRRNLTLLQKTFIISETINDRENLKKALESQWNSLLLKWRQIWPEVNGLASGGHQNSKQVFCRKLVLPITFLFSKIGEWSKRHRVCLVKPNLFIYDMTSKGQRKDFTWGQGHEVTQVGHVAYHKICLD